MADYISSKTICRRKQLFKNFDNWDESNTVDNCCDICNNITDVLHNIVFTDVSHNFVLLN